MRYNSYVVGKFYLNFKEQLQKTNAYISISVLRHENFMRVVLINLKSLAKMSFNPIMIFSVE